MLAKKRKQHYVWRHYLKAWSDEDGLICCLREGKIFRSNPMGIAHSRDFYRLRELTPREIELVKLAFVDNFPEHLKDISSDWIKIFGSVFEFRKCLEVHEMLDEEWNELLDIVVNNLEEELHADVETNSVRYLASLVEEDTSFVTSHEYMNFLVFLILQYVRTNKVKTNFLSAVHGVIPNINVEAVWSVSKHIFATNFAWNLYSKREKMKLYLLRNTTSAELITGDQPVVNTYATDTEKYQPVDDLELYYPITPRLGILITDQLSLRNGEILELNEDDVAVYNHHIFQNAHDQIYSLSRVSLEKLM